MNIQTEVSSAYHRIKRYVRETPLEYSFFLSDIVHNNVFLKLENIQHTGSFKFRGAIHKLLSLSPQEKAQGVIAASTGNHGLAVAYGAQLTGVRSTICLPENSLPQKVEMLKKYGVDLVLYGDNCVVAEQYARQESEKSGLVFISPYNDDKVVAGQGTIGIELVHQLDSIDFVFVSVGGGGLIGGIGGYLKGIDNNIHIVGCQPRNSSVMYASLQAGKIFEAEEFPTLSDGTAGGIEKNSITFDLCKRYIDEWVLVDEDEIKSAMKNVFNNQRLVIEGAAAVAVASLVKKQDSLRMVNNANIVIVLCGGNVDIETFKKLVF